jgi:hypothetical protein
MIPTDLPPSRAPFPGNPLPEQSGGAGKPADCAIIEEPIGGADRFTIPPGEGVVPAGHLLFAFVWAIVWTVALVLFVLVPNEHGPFFIFLFLVGGLAGEYLALFILCSACAARFGVETITLGPSEIVRQIRVGPVRHTRRVAIGRARGFRVDAFPGRRSAKGSRGWTAHLSLQVGGGSAGPVSPWERTRGAEIRLAEGARDVDKFWLADRLNRGLRAHQGRD